MTSISIRRRSMAKKLSILCPLLAFACVQLAPAAPDQDSPLASPSPQFTQVLQPRVWAFPADHGRHDGFKTEWWYFSGNLQDKAGTPFGYQLTFFRAAGSPLPATRPALFGPHDLYFAHAAISDIQGKRFSFKDRMQRARAGVAESSDRTLDVNLRNWRAKLDDQGRTHLSAQEDGFAIDLIADAGIGPVLEGPGGVNAKGTNPGQASYYYSEPLMLTRGKLTIGSESFDVDGQSWMDHEFSSNPLSPTQVGWDWIALSFQDRSSLMLYRIRNQSGAADYVSGTLISPQGQPKYLSASDIKMEGDHPWLSPSSGGNYPQRWRIAVTGHEPIIVQTLMTGQELITPHTTGVDYFEGAASASDKSGRSVGEGYLEMTGYATQNQTLLEQLVTFIRIAWQVWLAP